MPESSPSPSQEPSEIPPCDRTQALENLRVIRALMEKGRQYRAVSAAGAWVSGGLSIAAAATGLLAPDLFDRLDQNWPFVILWLSVLVMSACYHLMLLRETAGSPGLSDNMRAALRAMMPALLTGGILGFTLAWRLPVLGAIVWSVTYGLALHSMWSFSPRSIRRLAWLFLAAGWLAFLAFFLTPFSHNPNVASYLMGATFGGLHLFYAAMVSLPSRRDTTPSTPVE